MADSDKKTIDDVFGSLKANVEALEQQCAKLKEMNQSLEVFTGAIVHELRNKLSVALGYTGILLEKGDYYSHQHGDFLERLISNLHDTIERLDDIQRVSRLTYESIQKKPVNLSELAKKLADEIQASDANRQVNFDIIRDVIAYGDETALRLALRNLLSNAHKYTGKTPNTKIELGIKQQEGRTIYYVKDNGVGFPPDYADKLFKPYKRLNNSEEFQGSGFGLTIAKKIIDLHGGTIWAKGEEGKGATFYFTLPKNPQS